MLLDDFKKMTLGQFEAALCALNACTTACPESAWNAPVARLAFCQAAFHALFYADYYLGTGADGFREQAFHRDHQAEFGDYEELEDRVQQSLYERAFINAYTAYCRRKAAGVIAAETDQSLIAGTGFGHLPFSRGELYIYNTRHLQHHAAQLSLRLRLNDQGNIPWIRSGWQEA